MKSIVRGAIWEIVFFFALAGADLAITLEEVSNELVCQCGCGLVLNNCNHADCGVAIPMRKIIAEKIARGEDKERIVAHFVAQYGEVVLAAPVKRGFNLTAWVLPGVGIAVGGGVIAVVIVEWTRRRRDSLSSEESRGGGAPDKYEGIFERELRDFE
ncbi:MAG: cytochrome c-type biogenesis protein [bacterium]